jgi:hypothetical protein
MKCMTLAVIFILVAASAQSAVIWPDTVQARDTSLYYVAKLDTVHVSAKTEGDLTTVSTRVDTTMGKRFAVSLHYDRLMVSPQELNAISYFLFQRLNSDTTALRAGMGFPDVIAQKKAKK